MKNKIIGLLIDKFKNLDKKVHSLMIHGFSFSFVLSFIAIFLLITYDFFYSLPILFYIGMSLFKTSLSFLVTFIICSIGFDTLKKEMS